MTTEEIQIHIDTAIRSSFEGCASESGEMMTDAGGEGRFFGKVIATMYSSLPEGRVIYLAIGQTEKLTQIVKFGDSECLKPGVTELDLLLRKELGIGSGTTEEAGI